MLQLEYLIELNNITIDDSNIRNYHHQQQDYYFLLDGIHFARTVAIRGRYKGFKRGGTRRDE